MKPLARLILLLLALACAGAAHAQGRLPEPVRQALAQAGVPDSAVGIYVHEIGQPDPAVSVGADRALNPASTIKLLTTFAALELLGPAYTWNTPVYATGTLDGDVLNGNLVIRGVGDPQLTLEAFWLMLRAVRERGIREIRGDLLLDRGAFQIADADAARFDNEPSRPYNTPPDALLVSYKAVRLQFVPDAERRTLALLVEPRLPQVQVVNTAVVDNEPCGDWLARLTVNVQGDAERARIAVGGAYSARCGEQTRHYSVLSHIQYLHQLFTVLWRELGGTFSGAAREAPVPADARLVVSQRSPPLAEVIRGINKLSNNTMARQLYLTLGLEAGGAPATAGKAAQAIRQWLATKRLDMPELVLENGSGLSRAERMTARNLGELLLVAWKSPVMPELVSSLPLVAVDGTMRRRFNGHELAGQAHIKTGSLANVRAIAGYVLDRRGRRTVVVLIVNHPKAFAAQPVSDALLAWTYGR